MLRQTQIDAQQLFELPLELGQRLTLHGNLLLGVPTQTVLLQLLFRFLYAGGKSQTRPNIRDLQRETQLNKNEGRCDY